MRNWAEVGVRVRVSDEALFALTTQEVGEPERAVAIRKPPPDAIDAVVTHTDRDGGRAEYHVVAWDLAGNVSTPTTTILDRGCRADCASGSTPPIFALALFLALRRRAAGAGSRPTLFLALRGRA